MATQNSKVGKTTAVKSSKPKVEDKKVITSDTRGSFIMESKMNASTHN